jgi:murein DD-endopeptidase MepM/ murein hydrolase activator NlpD
MRNSKPPRTTVLRCLFRVPIVLAAFLVSVACGKVAPLLERPRASSAHERYADGLRDAGLDKTALGRDWLATASASTRTPLTITLPFHEAGYFAASEARAVAYALSLRDGQELTATAEISGTPMIVFLDLFRQTTDTASPLDLIASTDTNLTSGGARLTHVVKRDGVYVLRVQPELLRSGAFTLTVSTEPSLAFPVSGRDSRAIQSLFGAERDGGAREHHGIDIFAPRGTPALAAARGIVRSIAPNNLGGNVVWLSDLEHGQTLYYAHLDRHNVVAGQAVTVGDTIGFIGNTGNARTTPPHLHFGIYRRGEGPVNPYPFVYRSTARPLAITADTSELDQLARARATTPLLASPEARAPSLTTVASATPLRIDAAAGAFFQVRLPDGTAGYVAARRVESTRRALGRTEVATGTPLRDRPTASAAVIAQAPGGTLPVIGEYADYALVETSDGITAWVPSGRLK